MSDSPGLWMALHSVPDLGPATFRRLVERFGDVGRVLDQADRDKLAEVARLEPSVADGVLQAKARLGWAERTLRELTRRGGRVIRGLDPGYPPPLRDLRNPPPLLYAFGQWRGEDARAVGIVGATRASARARDIAWGLAMRLARAGVTVVSGYARGIDNSAHLGALDTGGRTTICLPCGIRRLEARPDWPPFGRVFEQGCALSEQPPDHEWSAEAALNRNRLIAALSRALIVVETRPKGGAMNTFDHAVELGRPAFAVAFARPAEGGRGNAICLARGAEPLNRLRDVDQVLRVVDAAGQAG